jgi:uncharacterized protein YhdP
MNLQALPRRIALDFRDVFSKGFRFDRIDATSRIERGALQLREFHMVGPAADVTMSGQVELAQETQDLKVRVVPSLGGTASTAVAIVNPVAGVAAALAWAASQWTGRTTFGTGTALACAALLLARRRKKVGNPRRTI